MSSHAQLQRRAALPSKNRRLEVLLLYDKPDRIAATVFAHVRALVEGSRHRVRLLSIVGSLPEELDLSRFDAIVIHYTLVVSDNRYLDAASRERLAAAPALKAVFIQDEYRFVNRTIAAFRAAGIDVLFTCVPEPEIEEVYPEERLPGVTKVNVLTGYVDASLTARVTRSLAERPIDVGYRARNVPPWLGDLGQEKIQIGTRFLAESAVAGVRCDISYREEDRLYGEDWIAFLSSCKAVLGVESGSSVFDVDGDIQEKVERALAADPELSYEEIRERYLKHVHGRIRLNQISPRCFEAVALRTLMVLYEGEYSGRLVPWRHYVPLKKDHSNLREVIGILQDLRRAQEIVDCAYREVALAAENSFAAMAAVFDRTLDEQHLRYAARTAPAYGDDEFEVLARLSARVSLRRLQRKLFTYGHLLFFKYVLSGVSARQRDRIQARLYRALRPIYRFICR